MTTHETTDTARVLIPLVVKRWHDDPNTLRTQSLRWLPNGALAHLTLHARRDHLYAAWRVVMQGRETGRHEITVRDGDDERVAAHWLGYCDGTIDAEDRWNPDGTLYRWREVWATWRRVLLPQFRRQVRQQGWRCLVSRGREALVLNDGGRITGYDEPYYGVPLTDKALREVVAMAQQAKATHVEVYEDFDACNNPFTFRDTDDLEIRACTHSLTVWRADKVTNTTG